MAGPWSGNGTIKGRLTIDGKPVSQHGSLKMVTDQQCRLPKRAIAERESGTAMWPRPERDIPDRQCTSDDTSWSALQKVA
jgi:hypothetical protein